MVVVHVTVDVVPSEDVAAVAVLEVRQKTGVKVPFPPCRILQGHSYERIGHFQRPFVYVHQSLRNSVVGLSDMLIPPEFRP